MNRRKARGNSSQTRNREAGVVIVLLVISIPILFMFVAFAIDLSIANNAREQARAFVRSTALLAIEQYGDEDGAGATMQARSMNRLDRCLQRVNEVLQRNHLVENDGHTFLPLQFRWQVMGTTDHRLLLPGTVYYTRPPASDSALCSQATEFPCFQEVDPAVHFQNPANADVPPPINGFRVESQMLAGGIATQIAHSVLKMPRLPIFASATATSVIKNIILLVDLSTSSVIKTHGAQPLFKQIESPEDGVGGFYAFPENRVTGAGPAGGCYDKTIKQNQQSFWCHWDFLKKSETDVNYQLASGGVHPHDRPVVSPYPNATQPSAIHYANDYYDTLGNVNRVSLVSYSSYSDPGRVNHYPPSSVYIQPNASFYIDRVTPPEPLSSIFVGVVAAVDALKQRANSGDRAGMILFEKNLWWSRVVRLTSDFDYMQKLAGYDPISQTTAIRQQMLELGFFPTDERYTDLPAALRAAYNQLAVNPLRLRRVPTADSIIYIGDYITNCVPGATAGSPSICGDSHTTTTSTPASFTRSVTAVQDIINTSLVPNRITFNVIHIGDHVAPHVLDVVKPGSNPPVCMSEGDAAAAGQFLILGGDPNGLNYRSTTDWNTAYWNASEQSPFFEAGKEAYNASRSTGGVYIPVLQKPAVCVPDQNGCQNISYPFRRTVDRQCRDPRLQISEALTSLIDRGSPFRIVQAS